MIKLHRKPWVVAGAVVILAAIAYLWMVRSFPINKVGLRSELIMLGDFDNDKRWTEEDRALLTAILKNPYGTDGRILLKADVNRNGLLDDEDIQMLSHLYQYGDPYVAEEIALQAGNPFPRPRELFKYHPTYEYLQAPIMSIADTLAGSTLSGPRTYRGYREQLILEINDEKKRLDRTLATTGNTIDTTPSNDSHVSDFDTLLQLMNAVEAAETMGVSSDAFVGNLPGFRAKLQLLITSDEFDSFMKGEVAHEAIWSRLEGLLLNELGLKVKIDSLEPPRDFSKIENYVDRAEWQRNKSANTKEDFIQLVLYAQYDRRYLRAVSRTSPRHEDIELNNHNLPMMLLFREAVRIKGGDKKAAIGLLDECLRVPFSWVKQIPPDRLPTSVAFENFLLPGNKEDGADKSRHWNVFGGIALYKTPEEALMLSLQREIADVRRANYSPDSVREFIRDLIANTNGIFWVVSMDPNRTHIETTTNIVPVSAHVQK